MDRTGVDKIIAVLIALGFAALLFSLAFMGFAWVYWTIWGCA